ncbi:MAG: lamin tail domain-containing protein [Caldilineaceae bacterium]|nr:lamin tail domain-containing protein [Caldilineaceae bacterium]
MIVENYSTAEILALRNDGASTVDVSGWRLDGSKGDDYCIIPSGATLQPGESFEAATGDSQPRGRGYKCGDKPIWNNSGETIFLKSTDGRVYQIESRQVR